LTKLEARKPDQRPIPNTYYYLDYKIFVDVVKYKIHRMGKELDSVMSKVQDREKGRGYFTAFSEGIHSGTRGGYSHPR
jgi:transcription initiation factor TFIIE subunit alpha